MVELTPGGVRRRRWDSKDPAALPHIVSSLPDSFPPSNYLPMVSPRANAFENNIKQKGHRTR